MTQDFITSGIAFYHILLAITAALAVAGLIWIVAPFFRRPPCYLCRIRPARFELGDYPLCRVCFEKIERCRRITEGIESETADEEIREYLRENPTP
jgi:hypothetical protein